MVVVRLIGLKHHQWNEIKDSIGVGNMVLVEHDPSLDNEKGKAYSVSYGGFLIGFLPLVPTLRGYYKEAPTDADRERIAEWGRATVKVREWLDSRMKYHHEESWSVPVQTVLFKDETGYNTNDSGEPRQISIAFEDIE